ncbi:MAG TPA: hypothetical protein DEA40_16565 [Parvularcula sp.]|nr:hypothetical protein [Parvularcula sp.]HBS35229.1 hypothetical protein [Parvularcula sp.]
MVRSAFAVLLGVVVGAILVFVVERMGHALFPAPPDFDAASATAVAALPLAAKVSVLAAWFVGALGGGAVASLIARRWAPAAWVVAMTILLLAGTSLAAIAHPLWMAIGAIPAALLGGWLAVVLTGARYGLPPRSGQKKLL